MRKLAWDKNGWDDYLYWQSQDRKTLRRINKLIDSVLKTPFEGIGKPEPLKENLSGARIEDSPVVENDRAWRLSPAKLSDARRASRVCAASRRINETDRLVYKVSDSYIIVISCRYHYQ